MNWKLFAAVVSAIAALLGAIAAFKDKETAPSVAMNQTGNQGIQVHGSGNTITVPPQIKSKTSIERFAGYIKADTSSGGMAESIRLGKVFNAFMARNDGRIVYLDISPYFTDYEYADWRKHRSRDIPPDDPTLIVVPHFCGLWSGQECHKTEGSVYHIRAKKEELLFNNSSTARFLRGHFRVRSFSLRMGWADYYLDPVSENHIDIIAR